MTTPNRLTLRRPDDWHVHLRDGIAYDADTPPVVGSVRMEM